MQVIDKENLESLIKDLKFQEFILKHLGDKNSDFNLTLVKKSSKNDPTSEILKYIKKCNDLKIDNEYTQPICKAIVENYCLILKNNIIELNNKILPSVDYLNFDRATKSTIFECCCLDKDKFAVKGILLDKRDKPNVRGSGTKWYKYQPTSKKSRTWIPKASIDTEDSFSVKFLDIDKKTHNEIWKKAEEYKPSMPLNNRKIYLEQNNMIICKLNLNMIKEEGSIWPGIRVIVSLPNKSHDNKIKCLRLNANKSASNLNDKAKKLINGLLKIFIEEHKNKPKVPRPKTKHFPGGKADPARMGVRALKVELKSLRVDCSKCVEKQELVQLLRSARTATVPGAGVLCNQVENPRKKLVIGKKKSPTPVYSNIGAAAKTKHDSENLDTENNGGFNTLIVEGTNIQQQKQDTENKKTNIPDRTPAPVVAVANSENTKIQQEKHKVNELELQINELEAKLKKEKQTNNKLRSDIKTLRATKSDPRIPRPRIGSIYACRISSWKLNGKKIYKVGSCVDDKIRHQQLQNHYPLEKLQFQVLCTNVSNLTHVEKNILHQRAIMKKANLKNLHNTTGDEYFVLDLPIIQKEVYEAVNYSNSC